MSTVERLKHSSEGLFYVHSTHESRHTMRSEIDALSARQAETISEHAKEISKHFGIYKQRERNESGKKDGDFIFMVRVKIPARRADAGAVARARRGGRSIRRRQPPPDRAPGRPVPLRARAQSERADSRDQPARQRRRLPAHDARRMRRRQSQHGRESDRRSRCRAAARFARTCACGGARDGAAELSLLPGVPRRSERAACGAAELRGADLRRAVLAAQVQSRLCASARQQRRSADAGRRLSSRASKGARSPATISTAAAGWARRTISPTRCRCSRFTSASCSASKCWRRCARSRRSSASMASAATGARRDGNTRFAASVSKRSKRLCASALESRSPTPNRVRCRRCAII